MIADTPPAFVCQVSGLHDGDNIYCGGKKYRLENIDAPEWRSSPRCKRARVVCDDKRALASTLALGRLLSAGKVMCRYATARTTYHRGLVRCTVNGIDIGEQMIREGYASRWPR